MGWFSRKPIPLAADKESAEAMRSLAEKFVSGVAADGWHFSWNPADVSQLDEACDAFLRTDPPAGMRHSMMGMGAYLGELMVRFGGGYWGYDAKERAAVVEMPNQIRAHPHNKVAKRLKRGPEHSLLAFYQYSLTRELPPGGKPTET